MNVGSPTPTGHLSGEYSGNLVTNLENGETLRMRRFQEKNTGISEKFRVWNQKETAWKREKESAGIQKMTLVCVGEDVSVKIEWRPWGTVGKALAAKPEDLRLIPGNHMEGGENRFQ